MDQFQEFYSKYKLILWPLISAAASIIVLVLVVIPQFLAYLDAKNQITSIINKSQVLEAKAQELSLIDESQTQKDLMIAFSVLPSDRDVPGTVAILEGLINDAQLKIKDKNYNQATKEVGKGSFQFTVKVEGSLDKVRKFFLNLQDSPKLFQVESIRATFLSGNEVEVDIPISAFYEPAPSQLSASLDQEIPKINEDEKKILADLSKRAVIDPNLSITSSGTDLPTEPGALPVIDDSGDYSAVPLGKEDPFE